VTGHTLSLSPFSPEVVNDAVGFGVPDATLYEQAIRVTRCNRMWSMRDEISGRHRFLPLCRNVVFHGQCEPTDAIRPLPMPAARPPVEADA